jgi:hypothetical protein
MMAQNTSTIDLIEVGEDKIQVYRAGSEMECTTAY